tara:strand:- start:2357 stop:2614 length:258 start_codon:yes stop_codon:yes gene_type:complete
MTTLAQAQRNTLKSLNREGGRLLSMKNNAEAIIRLSEGSVTPEIVEQIIMHALAIQHDAEDTQAALQNTAIAIGDLNVVAITQQG